MSWSNEYIGIPYAERGRSMDALDCWGLVQQVFQRELAIDLPSYDDRYEHTLDGNGFADAFASEESDWLRASKPQEFDVAWCRVVGIECHCGVILGSGRMLHAMEGMDSCIVKIDTPAWERRVVQCYRHR